MTSQSVTPVNPNDVVTWLVTQPNANGALYLKNVVRTYMSALRNAPDKLTLSLEGRDVFSCHTVDELDSLWNTFKSAPNYVEVNRTPWHGQLSAGLAVYRRYLEHIELVGNAAFSGTHSIQNIENNLRISKAVMAAVMEVLENCFPNGIRPNSVIDSHKFKNYYADATGRDIFDDVPDIPFVLEAVGIKHGEKIYAVSATGKQELSALFNRLLSENNRLFYYDELYDSHADFLQRIHIFSAGLLRTVLSSICTTLFYYNNYCQTDRNVTVESEILRCFESAICLSYDQLKDKLPYVPATSIRQALVQNSDFIWVYTGVYTYIRRIDFDKAECDKICSHIANAVSSHGFASLATVKVRASAELNPELSETAIRNGLYQTFLSNNYKKRGNIIAKKGSILNSATIFEDFCRSHDRLSVSELLDYEKEINGDVHSQSLFVAYDNMVRINRDTFVADSEIYFDVDSADDALARFVYGDVVPLRSVTSFTSFPFIDTYPWNWFMLESYCRRFSKQFRFQCLSVSSRNVGAIYKKAAGFADYAGVLAVAVAAEPIKLNQKEVGDFLFESGYVARRTNFIADVVAQARPLRERMV